MALSLAAFAGHAADDPKASRFYEDALTRYEKGDMPGAVIQLKNALKIDRRMLPVQVLLGKALLANSDVAAAEVALTEALDLGVNRAEVVLPLARAAIAQGKLPQVVEQPRFATAGLPPGVQAQLLLLRASALADMGDLRAAQKAVEDSRAIDSLTPDSWLTEVTVRIRGGQLKEALAAADKALSLTPELPQAFYLRGTVLHSQGDLPGALAAYDRALKNQASHVEALVSRAGLRLDLGQTAGAAADAAELLRISPREPRGKYLKAVIAERQGDAAGARAALADVTALLDPVPLDFLKFRPQVLMLGGLAHHGLNEKEKALPYLELVQRMQPGHPVTKLLAQIYIAQGNVDRATESLEAYLRAQPADAQAMQLLAAAHMAKGRHARATQLMQDALRGGGDQPAMRTLLGMSLIGGGKFANAVDELEAVVRKDPAQVTAGTALIGIYLQSAQAAKAVRVAEAMLKQRPKDPGLLSLAASARAANGDVDGARRAYEQALQADPAFTAPQIKLAQLDIAAKAYDKAATRLAAALRSDDKNSDALATQARLSEARGQLADAQRWLEKADDHSGLSNLDPALALVDFQLRQRRPDLAREAAKRLLNKAPDALPVLLTLARVNLASGDLPAAKAGLTRAASAASYNPTVLVQVALLQLQADHLAGAVHAIDKALAERPDFLPALALKGDIELRQGDAAKAEQIARQIVAKNPDVGVGHALLGDVAVSRRQLPQAIESYRKAHQIDRSTDSLLRLFRAVGAGDGPAGMRLAEQWLKAHPNDIEVNRALAGAQARAGNFAAARVTYEALLKAQPDDAEALNNLANAQLLAGDAAGATRSAERALQLRPSAPHILGTAGWTAFKAGQNDRGLQLLRDARLRDPANPDTRYFLSSVLAAMGRRTEAREELETALRGGRNFATAKDAEQLLSTLR